MVAKQGNLDYQIDMNGTIKTFHANLLKLYVRRVEAASQEPMEHGCAAVITDAEEHGAVQLHAPALEASPPLNWGFLFPV